MDPGLNNKVIAITGGTGKTTARLLISGGARIAICGRTPATVAQSVEELSQHGGEALGLTADMGRTDDATRFIEGTRPALPAM